MPVNTDLTVFHVTYNGFFSMWLRMVVYDFFHVCINTTMYIAILNSVVNHSQHCPSIACRFVWVYLRCSISISAPIYLDYRSWEQASLRWDRDQPFLDPPDHAVGSECFGDGITTVCYNPPRAHCHLEEHQVSNNIRINMFKPNLDY